MAITTPRTLRGWLQLPWLSLVWLWARIFTRTRRESIKVVFQSPDEARAMREHEHRRAMSIRHWCARHEGRGFRIKPVGVPIDPRWFWKLDRGAADRDEGYVPLWRLTRRPLEL